jgi:8-oxo-dGTP pyrophosphatase MutT (NUDIX family)
MDAGETPGETAVREIREEVGLAVMLGTLLVVDWVPPVGRDPGVAAFPARPAGLIPEAVSLTIEPGLGSLVRGLRSQPSVGDPPPVSGAAVRVRAGMDRAS